MQNLEIKGSHGDYDVPTVFFNAETGVCELKGESYLEKTAEFYDRLLAWLDEYIETVSNPITFNFRLTYFNTSSSKRILYILLKLKEYEDNGGEVTTNWYYDEDDTDMEEEIEDFRIISNLEINALPDSSLRWE
ncbi:MAG: DUF1987 domain-containing protein [Phaeodactylibacter sp.]|nr:DUF1987 domain-containing protein [Phaeodactylibacter sp.]MCB9289124.1 DUF1987 domain-containing protein [Lewinellaceae bacterium]